jgi:apolipoprotein N-acyltransferase
MSSPERAGWLCWSAAAASGALLALAFPPVARADFAWFALAPLLVALRSSSPRMGFRLGAVAGLAFWLMSLAWLWRLTDNGGPLPLVILGYAALSAYCALYVAWFGAAAAWVWRREWVRGASAGRIVAAVVAEPLLWAGTEYARGHVLGGFPWNALGVAQWANVQVIQVASVAGVSAVSVLLVAVNSGLASLTVRAFAFIRRDRSEPAAGRSFLAYRPISVELLLALAALAGAWLWGLQRAIAWHRAEPAAPSWRLALIQPHAPSFFELTEENVAQARETLLSQTALASHARPDLVVWPETALLGEVPLDPEAMLLASNGAAAADAPLLTGAVETEPGPGWDWRAGARFYNASCLFDRRGAFVGTYRKQHLVPFGEFIPLEGLFPALARLSPIGYSCTPGRESTVFAVPRADAPDDPARLRASPLICFEDIVAGLSRRAVRRGARLLVNQTNDGWFDGSTEPQQHMAQSVFRAVENGVPLVRSANGGVTCTIDPVGRVTRLISRGQETGFAGFLACRLAVPAEPLPAPYRRWGDAALGLPAVLLLCTVTAAAVLPRPRGERR